MGHWVSGWVNVLGVGHRLLGWAVGLWVRGMEYCMYACTYEAQGHKPNTAASCPVALLTSCLPPLNASCPEQFHYSPQPPHQSPPAPSC